MKYLAAYHLSVTSVPLTQTGTLPSPPGEKKKPHTSPLQGLLPQNETFIYTQRALLLSSHIT